jgi:dephospho-CoA kinase
MLTLKKVAVTGGLASGKTTVCCLLKELGAYVVSADLIVHQLLSPDTNLGKKIIDLLGSDIVKDAQFNKELIAKKVFSNKALLQCYEQIIHPEVVKKIDEEFKKAKDNNYKLFVAEIPLLYEVGLEKNFDFIVAVVATENIRCKRFMEKKQASSSDFTVRDARQLSMEEKKEKANFVIMNQEDLTSLKLQVKYLFNELVKDKE